MHEKLFIVLYKALVRPFLEYGNVVWKPYFKNDSELLERVQRRATKIVKSVRNESYPVRLKRLNLLSLVYRRKRADMIQLYRIMTGIDNLQSSKFIKMEKRITRGHIFKAFKPRASSRIKRNTLGYRAINEWNTLSNSVVSSENINQFKTRLESFWETQEFKYDPSRSLRHCLEVCRLIFRGWWLFAANYFLTKSSTEVVTKV